MTTTRPLIDSPAQPSACLSPKAIAFLRALKRNNDRDWFKAHKLRFDESLKLPMLAIIRKVTEAMERFAPDHVRPAEKCLFRIYRDTRFSNDKRPYKTHVAAWWSHEALAKTSGAGYYFHIDAKEVIIAAGAYMPDKDQLAAIRHWLLDHHAEFRKLLARPALRKSFQLFDGNALTRPPKGFLKDHPALDLIQCRQWGLSVTLPVAVALEPDFPALLIRHFKLAAPVVDALNTSLLAPPKSESNRLFRLP